MKVLIIGYGNRSRTDDGVGWYVVERLQSDRAPGVELLTAHQLEVELAETISQVDAVIFVDAAVPESAHPIMRETVKPSGRPHAVAHFLTPGDVLALCQTLYGRQPAAFLFSIRGHNFDFGTSLTPATEQAAGEVAWEIRQLVDLLCQKGASAVGGPSEQSSHA